MAPPEHLELTLTLPAHLADHRFEGRPVLPAVCALQLLARLALEQVPGSRPERSMEARFLRFLPLPALPGEVQVLAELSSDGETAVRATLLTRVSASGMRRTREHVQVSFARGSLGPSDDEPIPTLEGPVDLEVASDALYRDGVPFGPAFHNALSPIRLFPRGAEARLCSQRPSALDGPLGCTLILDAALHVACAWAERYRGLVAFPVGYARREVRCPTRPGEIYLGRVRPRVDATMAAPSGKLLFDIDILTPDGTLCEACRGVRMEDVSHGRLTPPAWIRAM